MRAAKARQAAAREGAEVPAGARLELRVRMPLEHFELEVDLESGARTVGLFGPSGAGKTSVLEVVAGWRRAAFAQVAYGGRVLVDTTRRVHLRPERRGIGYVPQDVLLFDHWNVWRNVTSGAQRRGPVDQRLVDRVLGVLELNGERRREVGSLSGGERQRVALARALCSRPDLLLLDEPLGALDRPLRRRILPYLIRVREEFGVPMLFVSHDATEVAAVCDEVAVLREGRVVAFGTPAEAFATEAGARAVGADLENVLVGRVVSVSEGTALVALAGGPELVVPRGELQPGQRAVVAVPSDDVLVASERPRGLSARNVLPARVVDWVVADGEVVLRVALAGAPPGAPGEAGPRLAVQLTPEALEELALRPGSEVYAIVKTRSTRVLSAP